MLNTINFENFIKKPSLDKECFEKLLTSEFTNFNDISNFPNYKGLYFLYYDSILLYIGSANAEKRTIKIRCRQYLQKGSGGKSFRGKIEQLKNIPAEEAIKFIKQKISAKFINFSELEKNKILQLEQIAIFSYQPTLNFMLNKFDYENLKVEYSEANKTLERNI